MFRYAVSHAVWGESRDPDIPGSLGGGPASSPGVPAKGGQTPSPYLTLFRAARKYFAPPEIVDRAICGNRTGNFRAAPPQY